MSQRTKSILLVEDDPMDLDLTLRAFRVSGISCPVHVCRDGVEALTYLRVKDATPNDGPVPTLVLMDVKLPKVDGIDVVRAMRADPRYRFVPVVMFSSSEEACDIKAAYESGANSYVGKGVNFDRFVSVLQHVSTYWLTVNAEIPL